MLNLEEIKTVIQKSDFDFRSNRLVIVASAMSVEFSSKPKLARCPAGPKLRDEKKFQWRVKQRSISNLERKFLATAGGLNMV